MKQAPLFAAVTLSVVFIIGAIWFRFSNTPSYAQANLSVVNQPTNQNVDNQAVTNPTIDTGILATTTPLTNTDLVSRQLLSDYMDLAVNGQDSEANITTLADKYADQIPNLIASPTIKLSDITVVPNTKTNFSTYSENLTKIITAYAQEVKTNSAGKSLSVGSNSYALARTFSKAYGETAKKLEVLQVPNDLLISHQKLVNSYLSSGAAADALSHGESDPATAFAGLVVFNKNLQEEPLILKEIDGILAANGV